MAGFALLQANSTIVSEDGAQITSLQQNTCNMDEHFSDAFTCVPFNSLQQSITPDSFLANFNEKFKTEHTALIDTLPVLVNNYTIYMVAFGEGVNLKGTTVTGPRIGICANDINLSETTLDTSGLGCASDEGLGHGQGRTTCSGSGGAHGGKGGYGSAYRSSDEADCQTRAKSGYFWGREARYEGSGGGSGVHYGGLGGSGGGIIWLTTPAGIQLYDSYLLANGADGKPDNATKTGSGGGAGGSIQLISNSISGNGRLETTGGDGSLGGGGGGSGGRLVSHFLQSYKFSN